MTGMLRAALFWPLLFAIAAINGALREFVLAPFLGSVARPLSGVTLILLLALAIAWFVRRFAPLPRREAVAIGLGWFSLTILAEALLLRGAGRPMADLAATFTWHAIAGGELFAVAAIFVAVAPALLAWWLSG